MYRLSAPAAALLALAALAACAFAVFSTVHGARRNDVSGIVGQLRQAPRPDAPTLPQGYATRGTLLWKHSATATR